MPAPTSPLHLLIVEDDVNLREIVYEVAKRTKAYASIGAVGDGQAACDYIWARIHAHESIPDFVLSDLSMPRMDGIQLIRELKRHAATRDIPIAIMTSSNLPNDREDATAAGCSAFFNKPLRADEMITLVGSLPRICGGHPIAPDKESAA
jgi:CheY-like chemotaxis protein